MSFGYSVGDAILLTGLAWRTFQNSRKACGEYDELTREVRVCHVVLSRLERELGKLDSLLFQEEDSEELEIITTGCGKVLKILDQILVKYNALSEEDRRGKRLWQKIRFGNGKVEEVREYRARLTYCTQALSLYLNLHTAGSIGRIEKQMREGSSDLKDIRVAVNNGFAQVLASSFHHGEGSILTTYPDDEKGIWKELRRELIKDNVRSSLIKEHKHIIIAYIKELGARGLLDDEDTQSSPGAGDDLDTAHEVEFQSAEAKELEARDLSDHDDSQNCPDAVDEPDVAHGVSLQSAKARAPVSLEDAQALSGGDLYGGPPNGNEEPIVAYSSKEPENDFESDGVHETSMEKAAHGQGVSPKPKLQFPRSEDFPELSNIYHRFQNRFGDELNLGKDRCDFRAPHKDPQRYAQTLRHMKQDLEALAKISVRFTDLGFKILKGELRQNMVETLSALSRMGNDDDWKWVDWTAGKGTDTLRRPLLKFLAGHELTFLRPRHPYQMIRTPRDANCRPARNISSQCTFCEPINDTQEVSIVQLECLHWCCTRCIDRLFKLSMIDTEYMRPTCCTERAIPILEKAGTEPFLTTWGRKYEEAMSTFPAFCSNKDCNEWIPPRHWSEDFTFDSTSAALRSTGMKNKYLAKCLNCKLEDQGGLVVQGE